MSTLTFTLANGEKTVVEAKPNDSVMRAAVLNDVPGIIAECGGNAMCATCHVFVENSVNLPEISASEDEMLDCTAEDRTESSRLSCQLQAVAGLEVRIPENQL